MTKLIFQEANGTRTEVQANAGDSVMQAAINANIAGIVAECGGACACATCHCYVEPDKLALLEAPSTTEADMLEFVIDPQDNSRLSCQIKVTDAMDGLVINVPASQT